MDNRIDKEKLLKAIRLAVGGDQQKVSSAIESGNMEEILGTLNPSDAAKIKQVLQNKEAAKRLLSSDKAKMLLAQLLKSDDGK